MAANPIPWPRSPLVRATDWHDQPNAPFPPQNIEWDTPTEFSYQGIHDPLTFYVELVSDRLRADSFFRIEVETIDENDTRIRVVHPKTQEYNVWPGKPEVLPLRVPLPGTTTRFKVTIGVLDARPMGGEDIWYDESRIYVARLTKCFIATAAYDSELAPPVQFLREFRDDVLLKSRYSRVFEKLFDVYYGFSPPIAKAMVRSKPFKYVMKYIVVWPVVATVGSSAFIIKLFVDNKKG